MGSRPKRACPVCGLRQYEYKNDVLLWAHFDYAMRRWCPGGRPPSAEQKARRKAKRSIRAVSGGLPS